MSRNATIIVLLGCLAHGTAPAFAGRNTALVDSQSGPPTTVGEFWCEFLTDHGHVCTLFPKEGPPGPLGSFDVVVDLSCEWTDPAGTLADFLRSGKTVITARCAPAALGIDSNPTVKAWIGADEYAVGWGRLITVATDPILGNLPSGTEVLHCGFSLCGAIASTGYHPNAKALANYEYPPSSIGILRNEWEGGLAIYLMEEVPGEIILNAVSARPTPIPTLSEWGALVLVLALGVAGVMVIRPRSETIEFLGANRVSLSAAVALM